MSFVEHVARRLADAIPAGRNRRLATGIVSGVLVKGLSFVFTLITVPMTLHYLGVERYGIWVTMVSLIAWIGLMNLGIANGLTPALSAAFGKDRPDLARQYVATAVWSLSFIALVAAAVIAAIWEFVDWGEVFNVEGAGITREISIALALAIAFFLVGLPLSVTQRILLAYQEGGTANFCQLLVSGAGVAGIYAVTKTEGGLVYLVLGYSGVQVSVQLAIFIWLFTFRKPELHPFVRPAPSEAKRVLSLGGLLFVCQLATLIMYNKDNLLITQFLGPADAAIYNVTWQLFLFLNAIGLIVAPYLSPSFGEAFASGDREWMWRAFKQYMRVSVGLSVPIIIFLVACYPFILEAWVGNGMESANSTIIWLALWSLVQAVLYPVVALLAGTGHLKSYAAFTMIAAAVALLMSVWLIQIYGVVGVIAASVLSWSVLVVVPAFVAVRATFDSIQTTSSVRPG